MVIGGSDGICKHIALRLAEEGVKVTVLDIQPLTFEARTSSSCSHGTRTAYQRFNIISHPARNIQLYDCDVTSPAAVSKTASTIRASLGAPTLLFKNDNVASILPILFTTESSVNRTFNFNILSHFRLVKEFLPTMISANHGTVITVAPLAVTVTTPGLVDYSCSKAAALAFHEGLASELKTLYAAPKVRTVCVLPGSTTTNMTIGVKNDAKFLMPNS